MSGKKVAADKEKEKGASSSSSTATSSGPSATVTGTPGGTPQTQTQSQTYSFLDDTPESSVTIPSVMITKSDMLSMLSSYEIAAAVLKQRRDDSKAAAKLRALQNGGPQAEVEENEEVTQEDGFQAVASESATKFSSSSPTAKSNDADGGNNDEDDINPRIKLNLQAIPSALDHDYMGNSHYPKLRAARNLIQVLGRGQWGAVLSSTNGQEWQLFIMAKADIAANLAASPVLAFTPGGHPLSTTVAFSLNPVEIYSNYLKKKCPSGITVDGRRIIAH